MKYTAEQIKQIISEKLPPGLVKPKHTRTAHFYMHEPTGKVFPSVTGFTGVLDMPHLKKWAANLASEFLLNTLNKDSFPMTDEKRSELHKLAVLQHQNVVEDAGQIGTKGHNVVEEYFDVWLDTGKKPADIRSFVKTADPREVALARSAELFCNDYSIEPIASELRVCSLRYRYAGTLDALFTGIIPPKGKVRCNDNLDHIWMDLSSKDKTNVQCMTCGCKAKREFILGDWKSSNSIDKEAYAMQTSAYWYALQELTGLKPDSIIIVRLDKYEAKYEVRKVVNIPSTFKAFLKCIDLFYWLNDKAPKLENLEAKEVVTLESLFTRV